MDKLSEFLPLLIIIASVVVSLVRKTKQPGKEIALPKEVFPQMPVYENPHPERKPVTPVVPGSGVPAQERKQPVAKKETISRKKTVEIPDIEEYESIDINLSDPEEMKKAVIYSEIFNRKDF